LLIIASSKFIKQPLVAYAKRREIETLFSCLKGRNALANGGRKMLNPSASKIMSVNYEPF
jgi:hypothetical protein